MTTIVFHAIADPTRRQILDLLRAESRTAGDIASRFVNLSRPAVSKHLGLLRRARLVSVRKQGREQIYTLNAAPLKEVSAWVQAYQAYWERQLQSLKSYVEESSKEESS